MAYPGELEDAEYMQYVISQQENGQPALPKDQWRQQKQQPQPTPVEGVTNALMQQRR
jgi:hypothetical protein